MDDVGLRRGILGCKPRGILGLGQMWVFFSGNKETVAVDLHLCQIELSLEWTKMSSASVYPVIGGGRDRKMRKKSKALVPFTQEVREKCISYYLESK